MKGYSLSNFLSDPIFRTEIRGIPLENLFSESTETLVVTVEEYMCGMFEEVDPKPPSILSVPKHCQAVLDEICEMLSTASSNAREVADPNLMEPGAHDESGLYEYYKHSEEGCFE